MFCLSRQTGRPYHNFISWQDMRSHSYVESWNKSITLKVCIKLFKQAVSVSNVQYVTLNIIIFNSLNSHSSFFV